MYIMARLIILVCTLLCINVGWLFCNEQQDDNNLDENVNIQKSMRNHFNEMGVKSSFINMQIDSPQRKDVKRNNNLISIDKNLYNKDVMISKPAGLQEKLDSHKMPAKRNVNKYKYYHNNEHFKNHRHQNIEDTNKEVSKRQPTEVLDGIKRLKNNKKPRMLYDVTNVSDTNSKSLSNNRKHHKPMKREQHLEMVINNSTKKFKIRPEIGYNVDDPLQHTSRDIEFIRNERNVNRRYQNDNYYEPKSSKKSRGNVETVGDNYNPYDMEQYRQNHYGRDEENKQHLSYDSKSEEKPLYDKIKDTIKKIKPYHHSEKVFNERRQLSNLNEDEPENNRELKGQTKTAYYTTKEDKTSTFTTEHSLNYKTTSKLYNISHSTITSSSVNSLTNTSQDDAAEYERFLRGELVDEFVKHVLTKVTRARKIRLELGFNNDTEESCERCAELVPCDIPELEDMKKSVEMLSTEDTMTCYKIPVTMDKYLSLLLPHKRDNKNRVTKKGEEDNFIFNEDTELLSEIDHNKEDNFRFSSQDLLLKNSYEKQRLNGESVEVINGDQMGNVHDLSPSDSNNKILENVKTEESKIDGRDTVDELITKDYFNHPPHQSNMNNKEASHAKIYNGPPKISDSNSFKDSRNNFLAYSHMYDNVFEPLKGQLDDTRELGHSLERNARKLKNEEENNDAFDYKAKIAGLSPSLYREEYGMQDRPEIKFRSWSRPNFENRNLKDKDESVKNEALSNSLDHNREDRYFNTKSNEYNNVWSDYINQPKLSVGSWQHDFDQGLDDSKMAIPNNIMYYNDDTKMLKRDTQPPLEVYPDDDSIFHEFSDLEYYDLY